MRGRVGPAVDVARQRLAGFDHADVVLGDICAAGLEPGTFDVILLNFVYYHLPAQARAAILAELTRLLAPGGRLIVRNPVSEKNGLTAETIRQELASTGLQEVQASQFQALSIIPCYHGVFQRT